MCLLILIENDFFYKEEDIKAEIYRNGPVQGLFFIIRSYSAINLIQPVKVQLTSIYSNS